MSDHEHDKCSFKQTLWHLVYRLKFLTRVGLECYCVTDLLGEHGIHSAQKFEQKKQWQQVWQKRQRQYHVICLGEAFGSVSLPRTPKDRMIVETSGPVSSRNLSLGSSHYPGFHRQEVVGKGFSSLRRRQKAGSSQLLSGWSAVWLLPALCLFPEVLMWVCGAHMATFAKRVCLPSVCCSSLGCFMWKAKARKGFLSFSLQRAADFPQGGVPEALERQFYFYWLKKKKNLTCALVSLNKLLLKYSIKAGTVKPSCNPSTWEEERGNGGSLATWDLDSKKKNSQSLMNIQIEKYQPYFLCNCPPALLQCVCTQVDVLVGMTQHFLLTRACFFKAPRYMCVLEMEIMFISAFTNVWL